MERSRTTPTIRRLLTALVLSAVATIPASAQDTDPLEATGYLTPPQEIYDAVMAPWYLNVDMDDIGPSYEYFVTDVQNRRMTPLSAMSKDYYNLAGEQIDFAAYARLHVGYGRRRSTRRRAAARRTSRSPTTRRRSAPSSGPPTAAGPPTSPTSTTARTST